MQHDGSFAARKPDAGFGRGPRSHHDWRFMGLDVEEMAPRAQVAVALSVLAPVALSGLLLVAFAPGLWWIFTTYGWIAFPAFGLLARGLAGTFDAAPAEVASGTKEKELLRALREHGELTPARAAIETSLTVAEADRMLGELADAGHLEVRARGGGLYYAPWRAEIGARP
jgi:hypothetical protein